MIHDTNDAPSIMRMKTNLKVREGHFTRKTSIINNIYSKQEEEEKLETSF